MKKILLVLSIIVCLFSSCNTTDEIDTVRKHIELNETRHGCKVTDVTIKEIKVENEFWEYTIDTVPKSSGTLFVAKIRKINKFGTSMPLEFKVYTLSDHNEVYEYRGKDRLDIFTAAYPNSLYKLIDYNL